MGLQPMGAQLWPVMQQLQEVSWRRATVTKTAESTTSGPQQRPPRTFRDSATTFLPLGDSVLPPETLEPKSDREERNDCVT